MKHSIVFNLWGGPGTGKSTTMAGIFHELKLVGESTEVASEWIKEKVWAGLENICKNQLYVFSKQHNKLWSLDGKVDYIITDSPLGLSYYYGKVVNESNEFFNLVSNKIHGFNNINIFLNRVKDYNKAGRLQNEEHAIEIDFELKTILRSMPNTFQIDADKFAAKKISDAILDMKYNHNNNIIDFNLPRFNP